VSLLENAPGTLGFLFAVMCWLAKRAEHRGCVVPSLTAWSCPYATAQFYYFFADNVSY